MNFNTWNDTSYYNHQPSTNIVYVSNAEEALVMSNNRGSDNVYFDRSRPVFYRVKVDYDGRKSWAEFPYTVPCDDTNNSKQEIDKLRADIEELKKLLIPKEVSSNGPDVTG